MHLSRLHKIRRALAWSLRSVFYDGHNTLSFSRVLIVFGILNVWTLVWLGVAWIWHVTVTQQMAEAAPFAASLATGLGAVASSQVIMAGFQYYIQTRHGAGSVTGEQLQADSREGFNAPS